ncbi:spatacsin [Patella vulgata]|uniref:spatacsin n=1 Tax=Patella vulgata TaxID=6465 RepID=UPI00217F5562|nr:spatacsin [Patella vulgata]
MATHRDVICKLDEKSSSLQCRISRLHQIIHLNETQKLHHDYKGQFMFLHDHDGNLNVLNSKTKQCLQILPSLLSSFSFDGKSNQIHGIDKNNNIQIYVYTAVNKTFVLINEIPFKDLQEQLVEAGIKEVNFVKILHCVGNNDLLLVNNSIITTVQVSQDDPYTIEVFILPVKNSDESCLYQMVADTLLVLQTDQVQISAYDVVKNSFIWKINLNKMEIEWRNILSWTMSHDLSYLLILSNKMIYHINIKDFILSNPNCLIENNRSSDNYSINQTFYTCHFGDQVWKENLSDLNRDIQKRSEPWYKQLFDKSSKQGVKISGFSKTSESKTEMLSAMFDKIYPIPERFENDKVEQIVINQQTVSIVFQNVDNKQVLCIIDLPKKQFYSHSVPSDQKIVLSNKPDFPHLVISRQYLIFISKSDTQEELVSKMMLYGGASSADQLCHLNKWERGSIPIPALEVGLKHRQLDTVAFFLKSKERLFSASSHQPPISPSASVEEASLWQPTFHHYGNIKNLEPALFLLVDTVKDCASHNQSHYFAHNLLTLTLNFLYDNLHDGLEVSKSLGTSEGDNRVREDLQKALDLLMNFIAELRCCLKLVNVKSPYRQQSSIRDVTGIMEEVDGSQIDPLDKGIEEAIEAAANQNDLPELQHHLLVKGKQTSYSQLVKIGVNTAVAHLAKHETEMAKIIILQLGFDYIEKLWDIVLYVNDYNLQQFILKQLQSSDDINQTQQELIKYIQILNKHYPLHSFSQAFFVKNSYSRSIQWSETNPLFRSRSNNQSDLSQVCGDIYHGNTEKTDGPYSALLLDWVTYWDEETKERVLLDTIILKSDFNMEDYKNHRLLWKYVLSHNLKTEAVYLLDLIIKQLRSKSAEERQNMTDWLWQSLKYAGSYIKLLITTELIKQGLFTENIHGDILPVLEDLVKVGGVIQKPHPLTNIHDLDLFHLTFINYCTNQQLVLPLWRYCQVHRLKLNQIHIENPDMVRWFDYFCKLFTISQSSSCSDAIFEASFSSSCYIWSSDLSLADMMVKDHVMAAIATLPFSPSPVHQISEDSGLFTGIDKLTIERTLKPFPKLYSALVPSSRESLQCDINIYQLLQDNAPFDVRRLFGWQNSNTLAGEDCRKVLPYFSQPELVSQFAYSEKIQFTYYLKQGRPCYAFLSFLAEELAPGTSTINNKRIQTACGISLWVAVKNFNRAQIASSCVAFVDMLGQDSVTIRTFLQVASTILSYKNTGLVANIEKHKITMKNNEEEIISLLGACIRRRRVYSPKVLILLEQAISDNIQKNNISSCSFEAADKWLLAVLFCHLQRLPLTTKFLEVCARSDKWLPFIWFAQFHQYPRQQLQGLLHQFRSRHLRDHLHYVIENADAKSLAAPREKLVQGEDDKQKTTGTKDVRSSLYSKIGVATAKENEEWSSEEEAEISLPPSLESLIKLEQEVPTVTLESAAEDVFGVVFDAQNTPSPWKSLLSHSVILKNPLFAELAFCENDSAILPCLCGWLVAMMDMSEHKKFLGNYGTSAYKWSMKELDILLDIYLKERWDFTLAVAFDIFQPEIPLLYFLKFSAEFIQRKDHEACKNYLGDFKEAMYSFSQQKEKEDLSLLDDSLWLEKSVYRIIKHYLTNLKSSYLLQHFLKLLDQENIALVFSFDVPDFGKLHKLSEILHINEIDLEKFSDLLLPTNSRYETACQSAVNQMIEKKSFIDARRFAELAKINGDYITVAQLENDKKTLISSNIWSSRVARINYWKHCSTCFKQNNQIALDAITQFFQKEVDVIENVEEKSVIYGLCYKHVVDLGTEMNKDLLDEFYCHMWKCRIMHHIQKIDCPEAVQPLDEILSSVQPEVSGKKLAEKSELLHYGKMPSATGESLSTLDEKEKEALDVLISELLTGGNIIESCRVTAVFSHYSQDLAIILTCIRLSIGSIEVDQIDPVLKKLLTQFKPRKSVSVLMSTSVSSMSLSGATSMWNNLPIEKEKVIETMERLQGYCVKGQQCCLRIITAFKVACILEMSYKDVVTSNEFDILRDLLNTDFAARFILAKDFLATSSLTDTEVAGFLADSILQTLSCDEDSDLTNDTLTSDRTMILNSGGAEQYIKLCQNPSILGDRLLQTVNTDTGEITHSTLTLHTELLVLAHECHTIACNMEGISHVLRAARIMTDNLSKAEEFPLMIRLLTGVGRFSEMTYIFDALKLHYQFEMLLRKGIEKEDKLKIAILDYLTRFHPADNDSYTMVALNFMMYREIANMLEERGKRCLKSLQQKPLENNKETQDALRESAQYFADAAERYVKENCVRHAHQCIRQARLVALQIQLLPAGITVVNLSTDQLTELMEHHPKFLDTLIVSEAYAKRCDWSAAIYNNVIINGDFRYLQDLKSHVQLKPALIQDAIERYQQSNSITSSNNTTTKSTNDQIILNIKKLLSCCKDIKTQYKLAVDLGFKDMINQMLKGDSGSYLQDIIALS